MEANIQAFLNNVDRDHDQLYESLKNEEAKNLHLREKVILLEKSLEKAKKFHRDYVDEVTSTEAIRIKDFKRDKSAYIDEIKELKKGYRQAVKDAEFYKKAHEELANQDASKEATAGTLSTCTAESQTMSFNLPSGVKKHTNSKEITKINLSLFEENKKLQSKLSEITATVRILKNKNQQLENFRRKIENKKIKFSRDAEELEKLIDSSKKKNKDTYTPDVLAMLGQLARNKK